MGVRVEERRDSPCVVLCCSASTLPHLQDPERVNHLPATLFLFLSPGSSKKEHPKTQVTGLTGSLGVTGQPPLTCTVPALTGVRLPARSFRLGRRLTPAELIRPQTAKHR